MAAQTTGPFLAWSNGVNDCLRGGSSFTIPNPAYIGLGLSTTVPEDNGTNITDPTYGSYDGPLAMTGKFGASSAGVTTTTALIQWTAVDGGAGAQSVRYVIIYDDASKTTPLFLYDIGSNVSIAEGEQPTIQIGNGTMTISGV